MPRRAAFAGNGFGGLANLLVVLAGAATFAGNGFGGLANLIVVSVVFAGAAILT